MISLLIYLPTNASSHIPKAYNPEASREKKQYLWEVGGDLDKFSMVVSNNAFTFVISPSIILPVSVSKYLSINVTHYRPSLYSE